MAKKMTVSVPDSLFERYEAVKDKLSASSIFQKAFEVAVEREERYAKQLQEDETMESIIERLKKEKNENVNATYELGRNEGLSWAKTAHYEDLVAAVNFEPQRESGEILDFSDNTEDEGTLAYAMSEFLSEHPEHASSEYGFLSEGAINYFKGFLESVRNFWEAVRSHLS